MASIGMPLYHVPTMVGAVHGPRVQVSGSAPLAYLWGFRASISSSFFNGATLRLKLLQ